MSLTPTEAAPGRPPRSANHQALRDLAARFSWISPIRAPDAPGLHFFGGQVEAEAFDYPGPHHPFSLSGKGRTADAAFEALAGEGAEHLSRLEWGDEAIRVSSHCALSHALAEHELDALFGLLGETSRDAQIPWLAARRLSDLQPVYVPARLCLHRRDAQTPPPASSPSTGCAAGVDACMATLAALLEVIERDALALWWRGGRRGRAVALEMSTAPALLAELRRGISTRRTWCLDITTELAVPTFVALSVDGDGRGLATGAAAHPDAALALERAVLELGQSELGHHIVAAKRKARGESALNPADRRKLARAALVASDYETLAPRALPAMHRIPPATGGEALLATVLDALAVQGFAPIGVDLTRAALGIPVQRVIVPGLQPFPSQITTARLKAILDESGACRESLPDVPLL